MGNPGSSSPLESVDRALRLVIMLQNSEALTVKDAAERLEVAPSTAHRLLNSLVHRDFAAQDRERRYIAGPALVQREATPVTVGTLRKLARPALEELHNRLDETVQLMVRQGEHIRFVDGVDDQTRTLRVVMRIGDQMPAYCSAGGKALLSELTNREVEQIYKRGLTPWPTARFSSLSALKRHLTEVRKAGYGTSIEETEQGVIGFGVTIHDAAGQAVAAFTTAVPSVRYRREDAPRYVETLRAAASACGQALAA